MAKCFWIDINRWKLHAWRYEEQIKFRTQKLLSFHCINDRKIKTYKTAILSVVLCGYETWYLTFLREYWLKIFEYRILTNIFGYKREQVMWGYRKSISKNLFICAPHHILLGWSNRGRWNGRGMWHVWGRRKVHGFGEEIWRKETTWKTQRRCEDNIKTDLNGIGWEGADWIQLTQNRENIWAVVNKVVNLRVPSNVENFLTSWEKLGNKKALFQN